MTSLTLIPLEVLQFEQMASGGRSLRLTTKVSWDDFPDYAKRVISLLGGVIRDQVESPSERVWSVTVMGAPFWIAFDDFALGISLDPRDSRAEQLIPELRELLLRHRPSDRKASREHN